MAKRKLKEHSYDDGSYASGKKKLGVLAFLLCLVISFAIWIYVTNQQNNQGTDEADPKDESVAMIDKAYSFDIV